MDVKVLKQIKEKEIKMDISLCILVTKMLTEISQNKNKEWSLENKLQKKIIFKKTFVEIKFKKTKLESS